MRTSLKTNEIIKKLDEFNKIRENIERQSIPHEKVENPYLDAGVEEDPVDEEQNPNEPPLEDLNAPPLSQAGT